MKVNALLLGAAISTHLFSASAFAQDAPAHYRPTGAELAGQDASPADLIVAIAQDTLAVDPDATIRAEISIGVVRDGIIQAQDPSGLPMTVEAEAAFDERGARVDSAVISMKFAVADYFEGGSLNASLMHLDISESTSRLKSKGQEKSSGTGNLSISSDQPDCAGFNPGDFFSIYTDSCTFGNVHTMWECRSSATGGEDWFGAEQYAHPPGLACVDS